MRYRPLNKKFAIQTRSLRVALAAFALAGLLAACAHPTSVQIGAPAQTVAETLGAPDSKLAAENGTSIWVYSAQAVGREVYWVYFDEKHRFVKTEEVLNEAHFALVRPGQSTIVEVQKLFGKPARHYTLHLLGEEAVIYRYLNFFGQGMAFWVQYNAQGVVTDASCIADPMEPIRIGLGGDR